MHRLRKHVRDNRIARAQSRRGKDHPRRRLCCEIVRQQQLHPLCFCNILNMYASVPLAGRSNVVRVEYRVAQQEPFFSYKTLEHFFSFDDAESCDFFLKQLQVRSSLRKKRLRFSFWSHLCSRLLDLNSFTRIVTDCHCGSHESIRVQIGNAALSASARCC